MIATSDGYRIVTDKATLDLRAGAFVAGDQVVTTGPLGQITSGSLHVAPAAATGEARRFSFGNGVRLIYDPPDPAMRTPCMRGLLGDACWRCCRGSRWRRREVPFGGLSHDATLPVEITADRLDLDQAAGSAVFSGTVKVGQGTLRLAADRVEVFYDEAAAAPTGKVQRMVATGNVTLANGTEAAEAEQRHLRGGGRDHRDGRRRAAHPGAERALEPDAEHRPQQGHRPARGAGADDLRARKPARRRLREPAPAISGSPRPAPGSRSATSPRATRAGRCCATCR